MLTQALGTGSVKKHVLHGLLPDLSNVGFLYRFLIQFYKVQNWFQNESGVQAVALTLAFMQLTNCIKKLYQGTIAFSESKRK